MGVIIPICLFGNTSPAGKQGRSKLVIRIRVVFLELVRVNLVPGHRCCIFQVCDVYYLSTATPCDPEPDTGIQQLSTKAQSVLSALLLASLRKGERLCDHARFWCKDS